MTLTGCLQDRQIVGFRALARAYIQGFDAEQRDGHKTVALLLLTQTQLRLRFYSYLASAVRIIRKLSAQPV